MKTCSSIYLNDFGRNYDENIDRGINKFLRAALSKKNFFVSNLQKVFLFLRLGDLVEECVWFIHYQQAFDLSKLKKLFREFVLWKDKKNHEEWRRNQTTRKYDEEFDKGVVCQPYYSNCEWVTKGTIEGVRDFGTGGRLVIVINYADDLDFFKKERTTER